MTPGELMHQDTETWRTCAPGYRLSGGHREGVRSWTTNLASYSHRFACLLRPDIRVSSKLNSRGIPGDRGYRLLDVNPRVWGWHSLGDRAGVDFSYLVWRMASGFPRHEDVQGSAG